MTASALRRSLESTLEPKRRQGVSFQPALAEVLPQVSSCSAGTEMQGGDVADHSSSSEILALAVTLAGQLQTALSRRVIIDQAIGVLRARIGADAAESLERLRRLSRTEKRKMVEVSQRIVDEAIARNE